MTRPLTRARWLLVLGVLGARLGSAAEPTAADQLPDRTIAYLSVQNTAELAERLQQSAIGLALQDPQVRPLVEHLWGSVVPQLQQLEEQMGMGLDDLAAAAPGELVLALVDVPDRPPAGVVMFRPEHPEALEQTLEQGANRLAENGFASSVDYVNGAEARILTREDGPIHEIVQLRLDDRRIITTDRIAAAALVARWQDSSIPSLTDNDAFRTIMSRCTSEDDNSQIQWYVDPISTVRAITRNNFGATAAMAFLPAVGADDLQAVGGKMIFANDQFDSLFRTHVLIEAPRDGIFKLVTLRRGTSEPEAWVPANAAAYVTWKWDFQEMVATLEGLVDSFRVEGALANLIKVYLSEPLGVDARHDLLPLLAGRITHLAWMEPPASMTSQSNAIGIELTDALHFKELWAAVVAKHSQNIEESTFAGVDVYRWRRNVERIEEGEDEDVTGRQERSDDPQEQQRRRRRRDARRRWQQLEPVAAVLGDDLVIADRMSLLEKIIMTYDDAQPRLRDELDYKLVMSMLKRQSTTVPSMVHFERPDEGLRILYQLLQTDDVRQQIHEQKDRQPFFAALDELLAENRFPPFEILAQYLAPTGSMLVNEESGFHHVSFGLRRQIKSPLGAK